MKIVVSEIPEVGLDVEDEEAVFIDASGRESKAHLSLRVEKLGSEVFIRGTVSAEVGLDCGRCLEPFGSELDVPVDMVYRPAKELTDDHQELGPDELEVGFYTGDEIDLGEVSNEQVLLNMPMKPLCKDDCKGICPLCGQNLNIKVCECKPVSNENDNRFGPLKKLLERGKE